jgi:hypothetical protein
VPPLVEEAVVKALARVPARRILFVAGGKAFYIVHSRTRQVRKIFSVTRDVIGPSRLSLDGRTAYFPRRVTEADVGLLTLR